MNKSLLLIFLAFFMTMPLVMEGKSAGLSEGFDFPAAPRATQLRSGRHVSLSARRHTPRRAPGFAPSNLKGCVYGTNNQEMTYGLYTIPQSSAMSFELVAPSVVAEYGGVKIGDYYYTAQLVDLYGNKKSRVFKWDMATWQPVSEEYCDEFTILASDVAYDPTTGNVYGCYYNEDRLGFTFGIGDYEARRSTKICDLSKGWNAIACTADGTVYAIDADGMLLKVDKATGATTVVGDTGLSPRHRSSGAIDPMNGRFFYAVHNENEAALYEVNLTTGSATWLYDFPGYEEITGMWVDTPLAADEAPAAVTSLAVDFDEGSLSGKVTFRVSDKLFNGTPATGDVTYTVKANDAVVATGTAAPGRVVQADITVPSRGEYEIAVSVSNSHGAGPAKSVSMFIGAGTPMMGEVALFRQDDKFMLVWDAVTASTDGGYIDTRAVEYRITRYPDNKLVATTRECSYTDVVPEPSSLTEYYYTVTAVAGGVSSAPSETPHVMLGSIEPPYSADLSNTAVFNSFKVIDSNGDGQTWTCVNDGATIAYNPSLAADDWLISPAIYLEAGSTYLLSFDTFGRSGSIVERIEVKYGQAPTAGAMTETALAPTDVKCKVDNPMHVSVNITPSVSGKYYFGFHGISPADRFNLYVNNVAVSSGSSVNAPLAPSDFRATASAEGLLTAGISLTAPTKTFAGNTLASIDRIDVLTGGKVLHSFSKPAPGAKLSCDVNVDKSGYYTFEAIAYAGEYASLAATAEAFVGVNIPAAVTDVKVVETAGRDGEVTLTWKAPASDVDGNAINPSLVRYIVAEIDEAGNADVVAANLTDCGYTYQAVAAGSEQKLIEWAVFAATESGNSDAVSVMDFAGKAFDTPYNESFANGTLIHDLFVDIISGESEWALCDDSRFGDVTSADGDNGFIMMNGFKYAVSAIQTGKVTIPADNPGLYYNIFNTGREESVNDALDVEVNAGDGWVSLSHTTISSLGSKLGWNRRYISLAAYAGKVVKLRFRAQTMAWSSVFIDNISIGTQPRHNIAVAAVTIPERVHAGATFHVTATIDNLGTDVAEAADYKVVLYRDGSEATTRTGKRLRSCTTLDFDFECVLGVMDAETVTYTVEAVMDSDSDKSDNRSADMTVSRVMPLHPTVSDLVATVDATGTKLAWQSPDLSIGSPDEVAESFENGEKFAVNRYGDWTFIDADDAVSGSVDGVALPSANAKSAFIVIDATHEEFNETWQAADGDKYLISLYAKGRANDDWAISPELYGGAQTVIFKAKTYFDKYGAEEFEFLYSTTGTDIADFVKIGETVKVPFAWTRYSYDLPAGARYFAIRCVSDNRFILMIDDFHFYPLSSVRTPVLGGYNVYHNGLKLNDSEVKEAAYHHAVTPGADDEYAVTAVYDLGESAPVTVRSSSSGIDDAVAAGAKVYALGRNIVVDSAAGMAVSVFTADGKTLRGFTSTGHDVIPVQTGVYVVSVGGKAVKMYVR